MTIDFWYENKMSDVAKISCFFADLDCEYRGNLYDKNGKIIGDFRTKNSVEVARKFKHLGFQFV